MSNITGSILVNISKSGAEISTGTCLLDCDMAGAQVHSGNQLVSASHAAMVLGSVTKFPVDLVVKNLATWDSEHPANNLLNISLDNNSSYPLVVHAGQTNKFTVNLATGTASYIRAKVTDPSATTIQIQVTACEIGTT